MHTTTYTAVRTLPFLPGGYILAYQRCCRNVTINNIVEPLATGATYTAEISETALNECNSSPKFNTWPPLYICAGFPIFFDQSVSDFDGDSVVYSLCAPYQGADQDIPMPQPPNPPPYPDVVWEDGFGVNDMLNGLDGANSPLTIDSETGFLTGTPEFIGQYVVGICVEEYRDGELIGVTRRDFQYNVGDCGEPGAAFFAPEVQCDDLTVDFLNQSQNADEYLWIFDTENDPGQTSTASDPSFTYDELGNYLVTLIVNPETVCVDTATQLISLIPNPLTPDFTFAYGECGDELIVEFTDNSTISESEITAWYWEFSLDGDLQISDLQNPEFTAATDGVAVVSLTVTSAVGCTAAVTLPVAIDVIEEQLVAEEVLVCAGESVNLHPNFTLGYTYAWSPADFLADPNAPNAFATPTQTTTYTVLITNPENGCQTERQITVNVPPPVTVDLGEDYTTCDPEVTLTAVAENAELYFWATDPDFDNIFSTQVSPTVIPLGETTYYLLARDEFGCGTFDEITITGNGVNLSVAPVTLLCPTDTVQIIAENDDPTDVLTYAWSPTENITEGENTATPSVTFDAAGSYLFYLTTQNQFGCERIDTVTVAAVDSTNQATFVSSQQCSGYSVFFQNESINAPYYIWNFGDPTTTDDVSTETNPTYTYPDPGVYTVTLFFPPEIDCAEPLTLQIEVGEPALVVDFTAEVTECTDSLTVTFTDQSSNNQSTIIDYAWTFSNGNTGNTPVTQTTVNAGGDLIAQLIITSEDGCTDTLAQTFNYELIEENLADTVTVCAGESVFLNPDFNPNYAYTWSPADFVNDANAANPLANPLSTTVYSVIISDESNGYLCEIEREVTALVPPVGDFEILGETESCGEALELNTVPGGNIEWSNDADFTDIFSTADTVSVVPVERSAFIYARRLDEFGCFLTDSLEIFNRTPLINLTGEFTICERDTLLLSLENQMPGDVLTIDWQPADRIIEITAEGDALVSPSQTTVYTAVAVNQFGCEATASTTVNFFSFTPPLIASAADDSLFLGQSTQLFSTEYDNFIYNWTPGGSLTSTNIPDPIATPTETTTYTVEIQNADGCTNIAEVRVFVTEAECIDPFIFIPNTFSPDGDGNNETFGILGNFIEESYLTVYNRWGEMMFESNRVGATWDGTLDGNPLAPDVYAYYARVRCVGGEEAEFKGNVTLLK